MAVAPVLPTVAPDRSLRAAAPRPVRFDTIVSSPPLRTRSAMGVVSMVIHGAMIAALIIVPLMGTVDLPEPDQVVRAFFVSPVQIAPPPPPPPPPAPGVRAAVKPPEVVRPTEPARFVAPIEIPTEVVPERSLDLGIEGGVPGGVEGGVPGGVVGGIIGGLPAAPAPPAKVVRVGGQLHPPKQIHRVDPKYPDLAREARVQGFVIIEAHVGVNGVVKDMKVLRSIPLLDDAAREAVAQWRYQPLLLNGEPTEFLLTVTVKFNLRAPEK